MVKASASSGGTEFPTEFTIKSFDSLSASVAKLCLNPHCCFTKSLSGSLIRTLEKDDDAASIVTWDILTENRLTPASGVYIYHIKADGIGETIGKMAIFIEKERLNVY